MATFCRNLAQIDPTTYKPDLAAYLHNLAACLSDVGDCSATSAAIRKTAEIHRELAVCDPAMYAPALAPCLYRLTERPAEVGHRDGALETAWGAVVAYRSLAHRRPKDFDRGLVDALRTYTSVPG